MKIDYLKIAKEARAFDLSYLPCGLVGGMDEVGRGPLAGPVVAALVVMDSDSSIIEGIRDSKKVSEKMRNKVFPLIEQNAIEIQTSFVEPEIIDEINILNATKKAFNTCVNSLNCKPEHLLLDYITGYNIHYPHSIHKKGDSLSYIIGCASIYAKVIRDEFMVKMDKVYPGYGFAKNKGYGTKEHIDGIKKLGACPIHRQSFIKNFL